jgi:DNA-binding transcriptional MerR regulator
MNAHEADDAALVGAVARELGVSVRSLHHWDGLGVATPSGRTPGGYRAYLPVDIARLRRVLLFRELGVPLEQIPPLLSAGSAERRAELERRRTELLEKIGRLQAIATDLDRLLAADEEGVLLSESERLAALGPGWDPSWSSAARERWGDSPQWAEYAERSARRTVDGWRNVVTSTHDVADALARAKRGGAMPGDDDANALAERHRLAMSEYFHCTLSMQVLLARLYVAEPEFAAHYDGIEPGLAAWTKTVIDANARAHGLDPETAVWE